MAGPQQRRRRRRFRPAPLIYLAAIAACLTWSAGALAAVNKITVNTLAWNTVTDGKCSLEEAINNLNAGFQQSPDCAAPGTTNEIVFSVSGTINLDQFTLPGDAIINGGGKITLASPDGEIVYSDVGGGGELENITINGEGKQTATGGCVYNDEGVIEIVNSTLTDCWAINGGAIYSNLGTVELISSRITDSSALENGGAIAGIDANIAVVQSDLEHNQGTGIIYDDAQGGTTEVLDSTIANNVVGSAILTGGPATITNSTIANSVGGDGGIEAWGPTLVTNSLIDSDGPQFGPYYPNPFGAGPSLTAPVARNDLIGGSGLTNASCGTFWDLGNNRATSSPGCSFTQTSSQDVPSLGLDPAGLQVNGGLVAPTEALCTAAGTPAGCAGPSPAIGAGSTSVCNSALVRGSDERGLPRPTTGCASGPFESDAASSPQKVPAVVQTDVTTALSSSASSVLAGTGVTLTAQLTNAGSTTATEVTFITGLSGATFPKPKATAGSCQTVGNGAVCSLGTLKPSASATVTIDATASGNGQPIAQQAGVVTAGLQNLGEDDLGQAVLTQSVSVNSIPDAVSLTSSASGPTTYGTPVTFTATVTPSTSSTVPAPTGNVQFDINGASYSAPISSKGVAKYTTTTLPGGSDSVYATYSNADYASARSPTLTQQVNKIATTTIVTVSSSEPILVGTPVTATVKVTAADGSTPTGSVVLQYDDTGQSVPLVNGVATYTWDESLEGSLFAAASYNGNAEYAASTDVVFYQSP